MRSVHGSYTRFMDRGPYSDAMDTRPMERPKYFLVAHPTRMREELRRIVSSLIAFRLSRSRSVNEIIRFQNQTTRDFETIE